MKQLIYTFRTTPFKEQIRTYASDTFVFGNLKVDFAVLSQKILKEKPDHIIGIAQTAGVSRMEPFAINQFHKTKQISAAGPKTISLYVPHKTPFKQAIKPTDSFCNWTAYKIAEFVADNALTTKVMFMHVQENDLKEGLSLLPILR
jgi:hypothetical protein